MNDLSPQKQSQVVLPQTPPPPPPLPEYGAVFMGPGQLAEAQVFVKEIASHSIIASGEHLVSLVLDGSEGETEKVPIQHLRRVTLSSLRLSGIDSFMGRLNMITQLNLSFNRITDASALAHLVNLRLLDISHNKIISIESVRELTSLHTLRCQHNQLEALEPLLGLMNLAELWVSDNLLSWQEFVFCMPLLRLRVLVMANNEGCGKDKVGDFVRALRPTLRNLDGVDVIEELAVERFYGDRGLAEIAFAQDGQDFLKSTDGRVMLAQAQAQLPRHRREALQQSQGSALRVEAYAAESHDRKSHGGHYNNVQAGRELTMRKAVHDSVYKRGRLQGTRATGTGQPATSSLSPDEHSIGGSSHSHSHSPERRELDKQGSIMHYNLSEDPSEFSVKSSGYGQQPRVAKFKAKHTGGRAAPPPRKRPEYGIGRAPPGGAHQAQGPNGLVSALVPGHPVDTYPYSLSQQASASSNIFPATAASAGAIASSADLHDGNGNGSHVVDREQDQKQEEEQLNLSPMRRSGQLEPVQVLRFGDNNSDNADASSIHMTEESMVALCLYPNTDGYARWQKGPVAASLEKGRLFCSYRNGSIAVMCDAYGNGSVMDTHGKNVLLLKAASKSRDNVTMSSATASVMNSKNGKLVSEYRHEAINDAALQGMHGGSGNAVTIGGQVGGGDDVLGESPQEAQLKPNPAGAAGAPAAQGNNSSQNQNRVHSWKFAGFLVEFEPSVWDLRVKFGNERMVCEFSSLHGGRLLKEKGGPAGVVNTTASGGVGVGADGTGNAEYISKRPAPLQPNNSQKAPLRSRLNRELAAKDHVAVRRDVSNIMKNLDSVISELDLKLPSKGGKDRDTKLPIIPKGKRR